VEVSMSSSGYTGQLILQHNDFSNQYSGGFQELREAKELLDVTLACEDDTIDVHKVVISASSPFFRKVLSKTKQSHPFIYLKGVKFTDLGTIIDFIYNGEATIGAGDVDRFLEAAQELQIKGLASDEEETNYKTNETVEEDMDETTEKISDAKNVIEKKIKAKEKQIVQIKKELEDGEVKSTELSDTVEMSDIKIDLDETQLKELRALIRENMEQCQNDEDVKMWKCKICAKESKKRDKMADHVESHLDKFTFTCEYCQKVMRTRKGLRSHVKYNHTNKNKEAGVKLEETVEEETAVE